MGLTEEFAIYMNYVRKLGFEEQPDYDFLRELFSKVLKTLGEPEDGVFDWMLLNGGKGWEAGNVCRHASMVMCVSSDVPCSHPPHSVWSKHTPAPVGKHHSVSARATTGTAAYPVSSSRRRKSQARQECRSPARRPCMSRAPGGRATCVPTRATCLM